MPETNLNRTKASASSGQDGTEAATLDKPTTVNPKQKSGSARTPIAVSIMLIVAALAAVVFLGLTMLNRIETIQADWNDYKAEAGSKGFYLSQIRSSLGYGGLIHHFKNYVLRRDPENMAQAQAQLSALREAIYGFRSTTDVQAELEALDEISSISITYVRNLAVAQALHGEGKSPIEVDAAVRIDDTPAITALALLESS
jgi:hypothetical protein